LGDAAFTCQEKDPPPGYEECLMPTPRGSHLTKLFVTIMALLLASGGLSYAMTAASSQDDAPEGDDVTLVEEVTEVSEETDEGDEDGDKPEKSPKAKKARSTEGCPEGFEGNHGQFVSSSEDKQAAAHAECGKPLKTDNPNKPEKSPKAEKTPKPEKTEKPEKSPKPEKTKTPKADDSDDSDDSDDDEQGEEDQDDV
jgi:hypothetical protein